MMLRVCAMTQMDSQQTVSEQWLVDIFHVGPWDTTHTLSNIGNDTINRKSHKHYSAWAL